MLACVGLAPPNRTPAAPPPAMRGTNGAAAALPEVLRNWQLEPEELARLRAKASASLEGGEPSRAAYIYSGVELRQEAGGALGRGELCIFAGGVDKEAVVWLGEVRRACT